MKDLGLLAWLTQLGTSVAVPIVGFVLLALYLQSRFQLGKWVVIAGVAVGFICAVRGFIYSLKMLDRMANKKRDTDVPSVSFNEHE